MFVEQPLATPHLSPYSPPLADKDLLVEDGPIGAEEGDWVEHLVIFRRLNQTISSCPPSLLTIRQMW